jgi:hypothetical protein
MRFAVLERFIGVPVDAEGATIDLRHPEIDEMDERAFDAAVMHQLGQLHQRALGIGGQLAIVLLGHRASGQFCSSSASSPAL